MDLRWMKYKQCSIMSIRCSKELLHPKPNVFLMETKSWLICLPFMDDPSCIDDAVCGLLVRDPIM